MRIGFIGLGNMGGPMALNVLKGGHSMVVTDIRHELAKPHLAQGARWADTPRAVAQASEVVFTSLPGPREVELVVLGADPVNLADQGGRVGREVDVQRAARGALEDAVGAEHD